MMHITANLDKKQLRIGSGTWRQLFCVKTTHNVTSPSEMDFSVPVGDVGLAALLEGYESEPDAVDAGDVNASGSDVEPEVLEDEAIEALEDGDAAMEALGEGVAPAAEPVGNISDSSEVDAASDSGSSDEDQHGNGIHGEWPTIPIPDAASSGGKRPVLCMHPDGATVAVHCRLHTNCRANRKYRKAPLGFLLAWKPWRRTRSTTLTRRKAGRHTNRPKLIRKF